MAKRNEGLGRARAAKNDEFYTQYADIEREMNAYLDYDQNVFRDKTILLPCDDPEWSNFSRYFAQNFQRFGLKKLISTSYATGSEPRTHGRLFTMTRDMTSDGKMNFQDLEWEYLEGDGDFRSVEVTAFRDEADIIITNPPFSLFREFLAWVVAADKKLVVIGSMNAITYKEVFPLIKENRIWLGNGFAAGNAYFSAPSMREYADGVADASTGLVKFRNVVWFTGLDHGRRHEPLALMSEADNIKFSKHKEIKGVGYRKYDNYDAIEVPFTDAIPSDYPGVMGVPISFLSKYNPDQFEILGITKPWDSSGLKTRTYPEQTQVDAGGRTSRVSKLNDGAALIVQGAPSSTHYLVGGARLVQMYARILIRHKEAN